MAETEGESSGMELVNVLASEVETNPEQLLIDKENVADIEAIRSSLSAPRIYIDFAFFRTKFLYLSII